LVAKECIPLFSAASFLVEQLKIATKKHSKSRLEKILLFKIPMVYP